MVAFVPMKTMMFEFDTKNAPNSIVNWSLSSLPLPRVFLLMWQLNWSSKHFVISSTATLSNRPVLIVRNIFDFSICSQIKSCRCDQSMCRGITRFEVASCWWTQCTKPTINYLKTWMDDLYAARMMMIARLWYAPSPPMITSSVHRLVRD